MAERYRTVAGVVKAVLGLVLDKGWANQKAVDHVLRRATLTKEETQAALRQFVVMRVDAERAKMRGQRPVQDAITDPVRPHLPLKRLAVENYLSTIEYSINRESKTFLDWDKSDRVYLIDKFRASEEAFSTRRRVVEKTDAACDERGVEIPRELPVETLRDIANQAIEVW